MSLLQKMFSFRGRTSRRFYWTFCAVHSAMYCVAAVLFYFAADRHLRPGTSLGSYAILAFVLGTAVLFVPAAAVFARRLHDRGRSGWWLVLGIALAFLAIATVLKYAPSFGNFVHPRDFVQAAIPFAANAALGFVPWSVAVLFFARGDAAYSYILPALLGVGPLLVFGLWFLIDVGLRRGIAVGNANGLLSTGSGGPLVDKTGPRQWLPISGAAMASIAGIVLLSGVLESHTMPCDMAQSITPVTPSAAREFEDCFEVNGKRACGPHMVEISAGSFQMGSNDAVSMPIHTVTFAKPFALGKFEVTAAQWETCVADGGCKNVNPEPWQQRSRDITGSRCRKPAGPDYNRITTEYLPWLSRKTGKAYRLPSESEWEYAARAGTTSKFTTGDRISADYENFDDSAPGRAKTIKGNWIDVGSLKPNPFGLHDMLGNSEEWVADIYNWNRYERAPTDGSAWTQAMQQSVLGDMRVVRGGSWASKSDVLSPTKREGRFPERGAGFRVALTVPTAVESLVAASNDQTTCASPFPSSDRIDACTRIIARAKARDSSEAELANHYGFRANALAASGRLDDAIADNALALKLSADTSYSIRIGQLYLRKKEYQRALDAFAAHKPPTLDDAQALGRAQALEGLGRKNEAVSAYERYEKEFGVPGFRGDEPRKIASEALNRLGVRTPDVPQAHKAPEGPCAAKQRDMEKLIAEGVAASKRGDKAATCALISPMNTAHYILCSCTDGAPQSRLEICLDQTGEPIRELRDKHNCR